MNSVTCVITRNVNGKGLSKIIPPMPVSKFNLKLVDQYQWAIGIDQSTSCTGICIRDLKGEFRVLIDIKHDKSVLRTVYFRDLFYLLKRLVENKDIRYLVYERPAPKNMYASRVLQELKGHLDEWIDQIPEFEYTTVESLFPQTWKKYIVDKSKGKGRSKIKKAIAEDLVDRFPLLYDYMDVYPFSDYDSFDACGIIEGYLQYAFDDMGNPKIHGTVEKTHIAKVGYYWCSKDRVNSVLRDIFGETLAFFDPVMMVQAEDKTLHENIRMASSNNRCVATFLNRKQLGPFMWKYEIDPDDQNHCMLMVILRKSEFTNKEIKIFESKMPWNEVVNGD